MSKTKPNRREFIRASALTGATLLGTRDLVAGEGANRAKSCILLMLVGGPSQFETFDPKPDAPAEIRGPFRSITTRTTGVRLSEHLPRLANLSHRYTIVRTVHHDAPPIHEAGLQLLQTGRLCPTGVGFPHVGAVLTQQSEPQRTGVAPFVILPAAIGNMGMGIANGQSRGFLDDRCDPHVESRLGDRLTTAERDRYGKSAFGDSCLRARQLVEAGTRCAVVNMFDTVYDRVTWDCHADRHSLASTLDDYRRTLCPMLDHALSALLGDLQERGMLNETLVVAMGEIGRSPRLNAHGGRDHSSRCWSIVLAGGGVRGGQVIGASDRHAAEPASRPVHCGEVAASIYHAMGLSPRTYLTLPDRQRASIVESSPIRELF